jgi:hypothetical protein
MDVIYFYVCWVVLILCITIRTIFSWMFLSHKKKLRNTAEEAPAVILQKFVDISKLKRHHLTHLAIATRWLSEPWHPSGCLCLFPLEESREIINVLCLWNRSGSGHPQLCCLQSPGTCPTQLLSIWNFNLVGNVCLDLQSMFATGLDVCSLHWPVYGWSSECLISRWLCDPLPVAPNLCFMVLSRSHFVQKFDLIVVHDMDYYIDKLDQLLLIFL